jgi:hypothetical protein
MFVKTTRFHSLLIAMLLAALATPSLALAANDHYRVQATLFGPTPLKGKARYEERQKSNGLLRRFKIEVQHGVPGQVHAIFVNGSQVGTVTVNALGRGKFELRTPQFISNPGDGQPMPANFPHLGTGDNVSVGPVSGTMFVINGGGGNPPIPHVQDFRLRGDLNGPGLASGHVEYRERFHNGAGLERRFKVEIEDATGNTNFPVRVNGTLVATITTNGQGFVEFQYRTAGFIDEPGDGIPMPANFPSLQDGDVVTVGSLSTTLEGSGGGGGGGGNGGGGGD